ncbi:translation initiation factor IF-3 [Candidatus Gottesmanbacteria bacterium]|nr:translation initiation factor IF-3 [Candidatus Gottesmanbacteria bacterium]
MKKNFKFYRLNYQITAATLRLLDEAGKQIGIISRLDALKLAQSQQKDLVEIAGKANPPVVKLIDFKKFKYLEAKKERESKKSAKNVGIKEIRLSPFIGDHDFKVRLMRGEAFLKAGNQLKIAVPFRGREIIHKEFGFNVLKRAKEYLQGISKVVKEPYFEGKILVTILASAKMEGKIQHEDKNT